MTTQQETPYVLLIEDNRSDANTIDRLFEEIDEEVALKTIHTGKGAEEFLFGNQLTDQKRPAIILLDFNLPGVDGRQLLARLKADAELQMLPVVVLTTSNSTSDQQRAYKAGANSYIVKPDNPKMFKQHLETLLQYWFDVASLPGNVQ